MPAHSHLSCLALLLALSVHPALTKAQTPNAPISVQAKDPAAPSKDTVLFDFEGGTYEGWTMEGDCWDTKPATAKTFLDKQGYSLITGMVGSGLLITHYKNPAGTGKAVSKDFLIDKPFLTFHIGGGYYPNQACLNLIVDGMIVRTETGNDSNELRPAYWDVSSFIGKSAHLEVVDSTPDPVRGYIMVDNIALATHEELPDQEMLSRTPTLLRRFAKTVKDFRARKGVYAEYGITQSEFDKLTARIPALVITPKFDHNPSLSLAERAQTIRDAVNIEVDKLGSDEKPVLLERMVLQGLYDWIRTHFHYSQYLAKEGLPREVKSPYWDPKRLMAMPSPYGVCAGYANTLVAMGKACGLDCFPVNGFGRRWFDSSKLSEDPMQTPHKWTMLRQSDGLLIPADPTNSSIALKLARQLPIAKWIVSGTLPSAPEDWAVYMAIYYTTIFSETGKALSKQDQLSLIDYSEWRSTDISNLKTQYTQSAGTMYWNSVLVK